MLRNALKYCILKSSFLLLVAISASYAYGEKTKNIIGFDYSEAADVFEIVDNLSLWSQTLSSDSYRKYFEKQKLAQDSDISWYQKYKKLREEIWSEASKLERSEGNLMTPSPWIKDDLLAQYFYQSENVEEALLKVQKKWGKEKALLLKEYILHFKARISPWVAQGNQQARRLKDLNKRFKKEKLYSHYKELAKFFKFPSRSPFQILLTWMPPDHQVQGVLHNKGMLLKLHPTKEINLETKGIILREMVHFITTLTPTAAQKIFSQKFLKGCGKNPKGPVLGWLEVPLSLALGPMAYNDKAKRGSGNLEIVADSWSLSLGAIGARLYYQAKRNRVNAYDDYFSKLGEACGHLLAL